MAAQSFVGKTNAPEFPTGLQWVNTETPLTMAQLRGKVVVLDFWTYCGVNCMHIFPQLRKLEKKFASELAVVGVHSAKFPNEKDADNLA